MEDINLIKVCLEDWSAHYPTGITYHNLQGDHIAGDYCDNFEEYKESIERYRDNIRKNRPTVQVVTDLNDLFETNVLDTVRQIKELIDSIIYGNEK